MSDRDTAATYMKFFTCAAAVSRALGPNNTGVGTRRRAKPLPLLQITELPAQLPTGLSSCVKVLIEANRVADDLCHQRPSNRGAALLVPHRSTEIGALERHHHTTASAGRSAVDVESRDVCRGNAGCQIEATAVGLQVDVEHDVLVCVTLHGRRFGGPAEGCRQRQSPALTVVGMGGQHRMAITRGKATAMTSAINRVRVIELSSGQWAATAPDMASHRYQDRAELVTTADAQRRAEPRGSAPILSVFEAHRK